MCNSPGISRSQETVAESGCVPAFLDRISSSTCLLHASESRRVHLPRYKDRRERGGKLNCIRQPPLSFCRLAINFPFRVRRNTDAAAVSR